jgi:tetratricopeptide (TPR) repeat protein
LRNLRLLAAILLLAGLAGCAKLHRQVVPFEGLAECPWQTAVGLAAKQNQLGPQSTTRTLECTLAFLRGTHDPALLRSSLGSRIALHLAERNPDPGQRETLAAEGVRFAEEALALGADRDAAVHYYLAANLGLAVRDHMTLAVQNLPRLESEIKRAVELNPGIDDGGPLRLLGMLYLKAPPWPTGVGDGDKALDLLRQAAEQYPNHPLNHLFYAQALWEVEEDGAADRVKAELVVGQEKLAQGDWGYSREPWAKEFAQFQKELEDSLSKADPRKNNPRPERRRRG